MRGLAEPTLDYAFSALRQSAPKESIGDETEEVIAATLGIAAALATGVGPAAQSQNAFNESC